MANNLLNKSEIPGISKTLTFIKGHGHTDQGHIKELREALLLITDSEDQEAIILCARVVAQLYGEMVRDLHCQAS